MDGWLDRYNLGTDLDGRIKNYTYLDRTDRNEVMNRCGSKGFFPIIN